MNRRLAAISGAAAAVVITMVLGLAGVPVQIALEPFVYLINIVLHVLHLLVFQIVDPTPSMYLESAKIPQEIAGSNNDFAIDFYKQILGDEEGKNIFFSPTAIYIAFSALYEGAWENTRSQMNDVFEFESDGIKRYNDAAHAMVAINRDDPHATLSIANALWITGWIELHYAYLDIMRAPYYVDVAKLSFTGDSVKKINNWAATKTNGKIDRVITKSDVNNRTSAVLTNTVYFKGIWATEFPKEGAHRSDFWINASSGKDADFMNVRDMFDYAESDGAQVLRMPYKGDRFSMLVILPTERHGLVALEESLSAQQMDRWIHNMSGREVIVTVPEFETKTRYNLIAPLMSMGITDVFNKAKADLDIHRSRSLGNLYLDIATQDAYVKISEDRFHRRHIDRHHIATQDAYVKINEEGTEAAAVTTINTIADSASPKPPRFTADHPFLFTIYDEESGMILFMGRISNPTV